MGCISVAKVILACKVVVQFFLWRFDEATKRTQLYKPENLLIITTITLTHASPSFFVFVIGEFQVKWEYVLYMFRLWMVFCWYGGMNLMNSKSKMKWKIVTNKFKLSGAHADKESVNKNISKGIYFSKYQQFQRLWQGYTHQTPTVFILYIFV